MNISLYLNNNLASRLDNHVKMEGISKSALIAQAVEKLLQEKEASKSKRGWSKEMLEFMNSTPSKEEIDFPPFESYRSEFKAWDPFKSVFDE